MRTFKCTCGNTLFFHNTRCFNCGKTTTMCPHCRTVSPLESVADGRGRCGNPDCRAEIQLCDNYAQHNACNRSVLVGQNGLPGQNGSQDRNGSSEGSEAKLCDFCQLNHVIPDLGDAENLVRWQRLEAAKHRVLDVVQRIGLPIHSSSDPKLSFDFKSDEAGPVSTGHADGCITINLREADDVEREKTRVEFGEPQRTLVGHFRHELGHYYWQLLVQPSRLQAFRKLFGNEEEPDYGASQQQYYSQGPPSDWRSKCISRYAAMHPWEDFAETFGAYLDMVTVLETAEHFGIAEKQDRSLDAILAEYHRVGILSNELNRDMGLKDLVPEVFTPTVIEKLQFVHDLIEQT